MFKLIKLLSSIFKNDICFNKKPEFYHFKTRAFEILDEENNVIYAFPITLKEMDDNWSYAKTFLIKALDLDVHESQVEIARYNRANDCTFRLFGKRYFLRQIFYSDYLKKMKNKEIDCVKEHPEFIARGQDYGEWSGLFCIVCYALKRGLK